MKDAVQTPTALLGITLAFSLVPGFFALLKAVPLIYPLNQKRVRRNRTGTGRPPRRRISLK